MLECLLQLGVGVRTRARSQGGVLPTLCTRTVFWLARQHVGKDDYAQKESLLLAEPLLSSLRTRASGPAFSNSPLLAICEPPPWNCARGCSPQMKALLQPGHPASCLGKSQASNRPFLLCSPRPASPATAQADFTCILHAYAHHTQTHAHVRPPL